MAGAQIASFVADLGEETAAQVVLDDVLSTFGSLDILVNNVAIRRYEALADAPWDTWDAMVRVNVLSFVSMARAALPALRRSGRGSIINVSSTYAIYGRKGMGAYDAAKAGLSRQPGGLYCVQGDYNNDGWLDIFVCRGAWKAEPVRPSLLRNNGDGTFTDVTEQAGLDQPPEAAEDDLLLQVQGMVAENLNTSLLGMSFLKRLDSFEIRDGVLTINWN